MNEDRLVVVVTKATTVELQTPDEVFAARFRKLGLTAYGHTRADALDNLKRLFNRFIHGHRREGTLVSRLESAGVEWSWADEYDGTYENTNQPPDPEEAPPPAANPRPVPAVVGPHTSLLAAAA